VLCVLSGAQNEVAMQLIVHHVKDQLKKVGEDGNRILLFKITDSLFVHCASLPSEDSTSGKEEALVGVLCSVMVCWSGYRSKLLTGQPNGDKLPESVHILPGKSQVRGMHTVIR